MPNQYVKKEPIDDGYRISDALWEKIQPLLPPPKPHPLGCHNPRKPDRLVLDAILLILRTGMAWNALNVTGPVAKSTAYDRYSEWVESGVFFRIWQMALSEYDALKGVDWEWLSMDGAMTKAPLGGEKNPPQSDRSRQGRRQAVNARRRQGSTDRLGN